MTALLFSIPALFTLALATSASAQTTLYATDFSTLDGWTTTSQCGGGYEWAADATPDSTGGSFLSPPHSLNFNNGVDFGGTGSWGGAYVSCGDATSPVIDLSAAANGVELRFWAKAHMEGGCLWDDLHVTILPAAGGVAFYDTCLNETHNLSSNWQQMTIALDPAWGEVRIVMGFHALDDWWNGGAGPFVDDLEVVAPCDGEWDTHCDGAPRVGSAEGASLAIQGSLSAFDNALRFQGGNYHPDTFSTLFGAPTADVLPAGNGVRCVGTAVSYRLGLAPTRDTGTPRWSLDLLAEPLAGSVLPGTTWYFQTIYRDGSSFNFSDAVSVTLCE